MDNKMSFVSRTVKDLYDENISYKNIRFQTLAGSFELTPQNIVAFFVESSINKKFLTV